jgi:AcrR family transcriptional regulator
MPLPRYERLDGVKKQKLLEAAKAEFVAKGYEGASLNDILEAAELGKSSYYYYFADKEDLYATVIEDMLARLDAETPQPDLSKLDVGSFWPTLEAYALAATNSFVRNQEQVALVRPLQSMWRMSPRLAPLVEKTRAQYRFAIELGQRLGCVRTDLDTDSLIAVVEAADQALDERFLIQGDLTPERLQAHSNLVVDTLRRLLEPSKA